MEFEQITKRLEWLDDQQRKSKTALGDLGQQLTSIETTVNALSKQLKGLAKEIEDLAPVTARLNQFDQMMEKQRGDLNKLVDAAEKRALRREQESAKLNRTELNEINKSITKIAAQLKFDEIDKQFKVQAHEEQRLNLAVQDMRTKVEEAAEKSDQVLIALKPIEEARRQDVKRLTDLQGELAAVRKRADDAREKSVLHTDSIRNMENRITELLETESERKTAQTAFLDQQAIAQVERDRAWKEWQEQYEVFKKQAENIQLQVAALDDTIRAAKRAQDAYTEINQKMERRTLEVSEMQRLAEERIRQEWVAFKADEQKRWTSHSLSQEETMRDLRKDIDKVEQRVTQLDDASQTLQDQLHQTTDTTEQQLQELMNVANEWLAAYERIMGHAKTKAKKTAR